MILVTPAVGVSIHPQDKDLRVLYQRVPNSVQNRIGLRDNVRAVGHKEDLLENDDLISADDRLDRVRTSIIIIDAVEVLRLIRTDIGRIREAIEVVVRIDTAIVILEAIEVLGSIRTEVHLVGDAILVDVFVRATKLVDGDVALRTRVGAAILAIDDPIPIIVELGATV